MKSDYGFYKALVFDYDGTLLDSVAYKNDKFFELFNDYEQHMDEIQSHFKSSTGISRFFSFKYIYENILKIPYNDSVGLKLSAKYKKLVFQEWEKLPLIKGVKYFFRKQKIPKFIASAMPQDELEKAVVINGIKKYITKLYGYPISKFQALENVKKNLNLEGNQILFFGDTLADLEAAMNAKTDFIARTEDPSKFPKDIRTIVDFRELLE